VNFVNVMNFAWVSAHLSRKLGLAYADGYMAEAEQSIAVFLGPIGELLDEVLNLF
jgi:hypothetical protein